MKKQYVVYVERYDYFDQFCEHKHHESGYETLGSTPAEALKAYHKLKDNDYDYGDSYQRTRNIRVIWIADKPKNNHNKPFTEEIDRLKKFPVVDYDGNIVDYIVTTERIVLYKPETLADMGYDCFGGFGFGEIRLVKRCDAALKKLGIEFGPINDDLNDEDFLIWRPF